MPAGTGSCSRPDPSVLILGDVRIDLAVGAFQIGIRHQRGFAVTRPGDIDETEIVVLDDAVEMRVDEAQSRRRAPVAEQARFDVGERKRLFQQRIVVEIDLSDREIVRRAPPGVEFAELFGIEGLGRRGHVRIPEGTVPG